MDQNERQPDSKLTIDRDTQINVVVNHSGEEDTTIDLGRVFHNMKIKWRVFAWVLVLCLMVGICAPLVMYQFSKPVLTVSSVVTLKYEVPMVRNEDDELIPLSESEEENPEIVWMPVYDLTAPDGEALDLSAITSSYVLQQALNGTELSHPISLTALRNNITIEVVLTDESRQTQELLSKMVSDKNSDAYKQLQEAELKYDCRFVVHLKNGFGDEDSAVKIELTDEELVMLLNRILTAYNDYMVKTYADLRLPDDEFTVIAEADLEPLDALEQMQEASDNLYAYCESQNDTVKNYRSSRDGRNLLEWMDIIRTQRESGIDYLYSYVYSNNIVADKPAMLAAYQRRQEKAKAELKTVNDNITSTKAILSAYKNDEVYVSVQESDSGRSTRVATENYNKLVLQQANNYVQVSRLKTQITDLDGRISSLSGSDASASKELVADAKEKLAYTLETSLSIYEGVKAHMEEIMESAFYKDYASHTVPQGKLPNFLAANAKKILIGAAVGAVLACGLWFLAALAPEFRKNRKDPDEDSQAADGKEAAEA